MGIANHDQRRCVHDEYGRIDPAKAAEPSKPRGSTTTKRQPRLSEEHPSKRHKLESDIDPQLMDVSGLPDIDMLIDPALMGDAFSTNVIHPPTESIVTHSDLDTDFTHNPVRDQSAAFHDDPDLAMADNEFYEEPHRTQEIKSDGVNRLRLDVDGNDHGVFSNIPPHMRQSPEVDISYSPITVDGTIAETPEKIDIKTEETDATLTGPQHSSRPSKQSDRIVTDRPSRSPAKAVSNAEGGSRASSFSEQTTETGVKSRRSSSNTSGTTHRVATANVRRTSQDTSVRPISRGSSAGSDMDADERFARELQAAENGLRRRASMKA